VAMAAVVAGCGWRDDRGVAPPSLQ